MKYLGALLILLSALAFGVRLCAEKRQHNRILRDLLECLELLQGELELSGAPIPELLQSLAEKVSGETGAFLCRLSIGMERLGEDSFSQIWSETAKSCFSLLCQEEKEELCRMGSILGRLDLDAQLRALRYCCCFLRGRLEEAVRAYPDKRRLTLSLCACAAVFTVILIF